MYVCMYICWFAFNFEHCGHAANSELLLVKGQLQAMVCKNKKLCKYENIFITIQIILSTVNVLPYSSVFSYICGKYFHTVIQWICIIWIFHLHELNDTCLKNWKEVSLMNSECSVGLLSSFFIVSFFYLFFLYN